MAQVLIFGDSITYGAWDKEGGWVNRLRKFLDEKNLTDPNFYYSCYNLGISGDTSKDLIERFEFETRQRLEDDEETIIIFAVGVNDSQFIYSESRHMVSKGGFKRNIQKLISLARKYSSKIIFIGLTPVDETKTVPQPWDANKSYTNRYVKEYDSIIGKVCKENKVYFVEIFEKLKGTDYQKLLEDGLHPNSEGHQKMFEIVEDFLIKNKII